MYYLAQDGRIYDDGKGEATSPAYGLDPWGRRVELSPAVSKDLTERFLRERGPGLGDLVARATSAVGIKPCPPCKRRQEYLNQLGTRIGSTIGAFFYGSHPSGG
jgi:hypothetical protein